MKKLMMSTAILAAMTVGAVAQDAGPFYDAQEPDAIRASEFIGMRVYSSETELEADAVQGADEAWNDIGEINDVILGHDGQVDAVLVDIGGFLGIGERQVALSMDAIRFVADDATADVESDFFLVVNATQEQLEGSTEYQLGGAQPAADASTDVAADTEVTEEPAEGATDMAADTATTEEPAADASTDVAADTAVTEEPAADASTDLAADTAVTEEPAADASTDLAADTAVTEQPAADATDMAAGDTAMEPMAREGYTTTASGDLTTDMLTGARVYGSEDEDIGEVSELVLTADGQITDAVIDVGGFLGIGEKPVAVALEELEILTNEDGSDIRVYVRMTGEELEALPRFEN